MFDEYLQVQIIDPKRKWRMLMAMNISGAIAGFSLLLVWMTEKMQITRVEPPAANYVMVEMLNLPKPILPIAQQIQRISSKAEATSVTSQKPNYTTAKQNLGSKNSEPEQTDDAGETQTSKQGIGIPGTHECGATCNLIGSIHGQGSAVPPTSNQASQPPKQIAFSRSQCIACADPEQKQLQATNAAHSGRAGGRNVTHYCISPSGQVTDVSTEKAFPGDPEVDRICRETVRKWRFKPSLVNGQPLKTCTSVTFNLHFL